MDIANITNKIQQGNISLGIELGSTRIKSVLITDQFETIASGNYVWENKFENGLWTYSLDEVWVGIQHSFSEMAAVVQRKYETTITTIDTIGISAMMHGYLAFSENGNLLAPFRTWRNNNTAQATDKLTELFNFNIPHRWSIAHLYQAILNEESHVKDIHYMTTLSGYVHWMLSGEKC